MRPMDYAIGRLSFAIMARAFGFCVDRLACIAVLFVISSCSKPIPPKADLAISLYDMVNGRIVPIVVWHEDSFVVFSSDLDNGGEPYWSTLLEPAASEELRSLCSAAARVNDSWGLPEDSCVELMSFDRDGRSVAFWRWPWRPGLHNELFPRLSARLLSLDTSRSATAAPRLEMFSHEGDPQSLRESGFWCPYGSAR